MHPQAAASGRRRNAAVLALLLAALWFGGCTVTPQALEPPPERDAPNVSTAAETPEEYRGVRVRWGGTIAGVENRADSTLVEVVARPLGRDSRPRGDDRSEGRFLAVIPGFLDPAIYEEGRELTVAGTLDGIEERPVGDYPYHYPRIQATGHHLWPRPVAPPAYPRGWYDPWYDPWWDDPWYRHRHPHRRW